MLSRSTYAVLLSSGHTLRACGAGGAWSMEQDSAGAGGGEATVARCVRAQSSLCPPLTLAAPTAARLNLEREMRAT